ncbi:sulfatase [Echinicola soli]|uniref:Sulfatase n=1 Tax=Echinicola soli TaxID=2591634 RepID=A0A514CNC2_9BACT|nr:sulfatase [Echinicola soli]QDH81298.1 sulfatase [Echinicola soli]
MIGVITYRILVLTALAISVSAKSLAGIRGDRPNIVFILADDLGWADLPVYGNRFNEAPNLAQLAKEGMRFTEAYASAPVCSPSRASIMSGQYPARVGVVDFIPGHWRPYEKMQVPINRTQYLPAQVETFAEALQDAGYATGYFGKWHLGEGEEMENLHPLNQGFEVANTGKGYYGGRFTPSREGNPEKRFSERITDFGVEFIQKQKDQPFFLFLSHFDVHVQLNADQDLIDKYLGKDKVEGYPCNAVYAAMIAHIDHSVGRVMEKLESVGLSEQTIVVFFSDNGGLVSRYDKRTLLANSRQEVYRHGPLQYIASSNLPLRGEKGTVYEGGIRVPLLLKWPGKIKPGSVSGALVSSVDLYPTFLEMADVEMPREQVMDGESILPALLSDRYDPDRALYWHYPVYHHGVPAGAVRKGDWKLIEDQVSGSVSLYHLSSDIGESTDLSAQYPKKTGELYEQLKQWQKDIGAELPRPNADYDDDRRLEWGIHPDR